MSSGQPPASGQTRDSSSQVRAVRLIVNEHRQLASVLILLESLVEQVVAGKSAPDFRLLATVLCYIDTFPERFHHPKEDQYLFTALRGRTGSATALLERLSQDHRTSEHFLLGLDRCFVAFQAHLPGATRNFSDACAAFVRFHIDHMQTEETELLPLAAKHLTQGDWENIAAAWAANEDPLRGMDSQATFARLRASIAEQVPEKMRRVFSRIDGDLEQP